MLPMGVILSDNSGTIPCALIRIETEITPLKQIHTKHSVVSCTDHQVNWGNDLGRHTSSCTCLLQVSKLRCNYRQVAEIKSHHICMVKKETRCPLCLEANIITAFLWCHRRCFELMFLVSFDPLFSMQPAAPPATKANLTAALTKRTNGR